MTEPATEKQIKFASSLGIANPDRYSKQALKEMISEKLGDSETEKIPVERPMEQQKSAQNGSNGAMFTSYAKDVFCVMFERLLINENQLPADDLMKLSIALVKQAKEAFE